MVKSIVRSLQKWLLALSLAKFEKCEANKTVARAMSAEFW